jgi:hypothetical protein
MSEAILERLVAIVENGSYGGSTLGAKALRSFVGSIDPIAKPVVLILKKANSGWVKSAGHGIYQTNLICQMSYYIQAAGDGNQETGIADATNLELLATKIFLSRPQLQLAGQTSVYLTDVVEEISLRTISNLALTIPYPPSSVSSGQGATLYWGFIHELTIPYQIPIELSYEG